jgi:hypothetical protein
MHVSRRDWMKFAGTMSIGLMVILGWHMPVRGDSLNTNVIRLDENHRQLFLDDSLIASRNHVVRTLHQGKKRPEPVLVGDKPWEGPIIAMPVVLYSQERDLFQMWYMQGFYAPPEPRYLCYAESKDGIHWEKPNLGLVEYNGLKDNNIIWSRRIHQGWIMLDTHEKDPANRYKGLNERFEAMYSPDGIHWTVGEQTVGMTEEDDQPGLFYDASLKKYVFVKRLMDRSIFRRMIQTAFSDDFIHWEVHPHVFKPDEDDAVHVARRGAQRLDFHSASPLPYEGIYLGWVDCFYLRPIMPPNEKKDQFLPGTPGSHGHYYHDGTLAPELTWSRDAVHWNRVERGTPVIARGPAGAFDHGFVVATMSPHVIKDEIWVYYTGAKCTFACGAKYHGQPASEDHAHDREKHQAMAIGLARWKLDRLVSLDADGTFRSVITKPLQFSGNSLTVNADAAEGELQVELLDTSGNAIGGYNADQCEALQSDSLSHTVRWAGKPRLPDQRPLRLRFKIRNTSLYSFQIKE